MEKMLQPAFIVIVRRDVLTELRDEADRRYGAAEDRYDETSDEELMELACEDMEFWERVHLWLSDKLESLPR